MSKTNVIAIFCSDMHLSHNQPRWRDELDWYAAQKRVLDEVLFLSQENNDCPVFCAGDIFDVWNSPAQLINFAIDNLPSNFYSIAGQHDLPYHQIDEIHKSAYATLNKARHCHLHKEYIDKNITVYPYNWKEEIVKRNDLDKNKLNIALIHEYAWIDGCNFTGCKDEYKISDKRKTLTQFDLVVFGDNHKGFLTHINKTKILNCGTMMRRKSDEIDYKPRIGLLYSDGNMDLHFLNIKEDKHISEVKEKENKKIDSKEFIAELKNTDKTELDFKTNIYNYIATIEDDSIEIDNVKKHIQKAME